VATSIILTVFVTIYCNSLVAEPSVNWYHKVRPNGQVLVGPWYSWPNTSPCHGEDRRFESGRARHRKKSCRSTALFSMISSAHDADRRSRFRILSNL
jgi:hypothetical protein